MTATMTARDAISPIKREVFDTATAAVDGGVHLLEVLPQLLDSPTGELRVEEDGETVGVIDQRSMLEALGRMIAPRYDCSVIEVECAAGDYSASHIARAVEDSDVHLVDLLTTPGAEGRIHVTLRVRCEDPTSTTHCLERYGYAVTDVHGHEYAGLTASMERLLALQTMINV